MASNTIHHGSGEIAIVRATADDVPVVLNILDATVKWLVSRGETTQWGTTPFPEVSRRTKQLEEYATTGLGIWLAIKVADDTPIGQNQHSKGMNGGASRTIIGALAIRERVSHIPPVSEPELYVQLVVTDRQWAGKGVGKRLLEHARDLANEVGVALLRVDCYAGGDGISVQYYESHGFKRSGSFRLESG
ncbi:Acyl-CoA N-acyltransferase [Penicillium camemberti]|uniref:Acyl-CoA N-acyltransferase n=1 Tax=Penicillium camemberti (strain FM 013) TaxID=1429867 RepID=A0A0G4P1Z9_PENC3|nr:Acyl-CoA N-acyltransferase [Penicillium camemberti]